VADVVSLEALRLTKTASLAAAGLATLISLPLAAIPATHDGHDLPHDPELRLSPAEREAFRQDVEHLQQNFYQASPEMRRRWIEAVRERRQRLDMQEDEAALAVFPQPNVRSSRATSPELPRSSVIRSPARERLAD
jgi:hypothetical protein